VRGVTFHYGSSTQQKDGTVATDLVDGANIRVRGTLPSGGTGNAEATEIDFRPEGAPPLFVFQRASGPAGRRAGERRPRGRCRPGSRAARH
jgi:hypothetical protein